MTVGLDTKFDLMVYSDTKRRCYISLFHYPLDGEMIDWP